MASIQKDLFKHDKERHLSMRKMLLAVTVCQDFKTGFIGERGRGEKFSKLAL